MTQNNLSNLFLISIEHETAEKIDFDNLLETFILQNLERWKYNLCSVNFLKIYRFSCANQRH